MGPRAGVDILKKSKLLTPHWNQTLNCPAHSLANIPNAGCSNVCVCVCACVRVMYISGNWHCPM